MIIHSGPNSNFPEPHDGQFTWRIGAGEIKNCQLEDWFTVDELWTNLKDAREDAYKHIALITEKGFKVEIAYLSGYTSDGNYAVSCHTIKEAFTDKLVFQKPTLHYRGSFWSGKDTRVNRVKTMATIDPTSPSDTVGLTWSDLYNSLRTMVK